jgi:hypothetical protein
MKIIENKEIAIEESNKFLFTDKDGKFNAPFYKDFLITALNTKIEGFTLDDMRKRLKLRDIVDNFEPFGRHEIEDADFLVLKDAVSKVEKWKILDKGILEFLEFFDKN